MHFQDAKRMSLNGISPISVLMQNKSFPLNYLATINYASKLPPCSYTTKQVI
jgi:hypothetical protein